MRRQIATSILRGIAQDGSRCMARNDGGRRAIQIAATPSTSTNEISTGAQTDVVQPDARFEVIGSPFSLLSVTLSASQPLYTRRGTLAALHGKPENVISTLSILSPITRSIGLIPFLYQKITSTSPTTALIAARKSSATSFATIYLDGRVDWIVAQRTGLLAWTGAGLIVKPRLNTSLSLANWGQTKLTGRGLLALSGKGQLYTVTLGQNEDYIVHPSQILAYSSTSSPQNENPTPYRFKSTSLNLTIPNVLSIFPKSRFISEMNKTPFVRFMKKSTYKIRTWTRRTIWGDRLFLRFQGPCTIILQSRGNSLREVLTSREVDEIADSPLPSSTSSSLKAKSGSEDRGKGDSLAASGLGLPSSSSSEEKPTQLKFATVGKDGKVEIK